MKKSILLAICLAVSLSAIVAQEKSEKKPRPDFHNSYYDTKRALHESFPVKRNTIVMLGNSLTDHGVWSEYFPSQIVVNRGIGGDRLPGFIDRLPSIIKTKPKKIFIMGGVNDVIFTPEVSFETLLEDFQTMVDMIKKGSSKTEIFIQSLLPVNENVPKDHTYFVGKNEPIQEFNKLLREFANNNKIQFINVYFAMEKNGELNIDLTTDGIHLKPAAYTLWTDYLRPYLEK